MNISLRKANAVQTAINDALKSIKIDLVVSINEFQSVEAELTRANAELFANDARRQKLLLALYNIRSLVGTANVQCGIDTKLATAAFLDKRVAQLESMTSASVVGDLVVLNGKLDKIKNRPADSRASVYGYDDNVSSGVISQAQMDQIKAEIKNLKKQKQKINDEVLELNIKTEIPLNDEVVATLTAEGLI
jgi:hypothetical protein